MSTVIWGFYIYRGMNFWRCRKLWSSNGCFFSSSFPNDHQGTYDVISLSAAVHLFVVSGITFYKSMFPSFFHYLHDTDTSVTGQIIPTLFLGVGRQWNVFFLARVFHEPAGQAWRSTEDDFWVGICNLFRVPAITRPLHNIFFFNPALNVHQLSRCWRMSSTP